MARLLAAGLTLAAALTGSTPAHAAPPPLIPPTMDFTAGPRTDEVRAGSRIQLTGRITSYTGSDTGRVEISFQKQDSERKVRVGTARVPRSGSFSLATTATGSGEYSAVYLSDTQARNRASASDYLGVFTTRTSNRTVYTWTATDLDCRFTCRQVSPAVQLSPGFVQVGLTRDCVQPRSAGRVGFTTDPATAPQPGDRGWREFPGGVGPEVFDLSPTARNGRFVIEWTSPAGATAAALTSCRLRFTATQKSTLKEYV